MVVTRVITAHGRSSHTTPQKANLVEGSTKGVQLHRQFSIVNIYSSRHMRLGGI